eukprot:CAMPEP_0170790466 /NCGR_PEP_ID=MMETSP0733-20121128/20447_1 /TAXON_ID=186038 /ORGANISM="Fragilariopsis kerguelensis, Strain L26-C5" /LENGTH=144 /DNA_ID=CAMNT_0011137973 /DNA_START=107 /DNA_END=539 /DNA_ORIENTATION=+
MSKPPGHNTNYRLIDPAIILMDSIEHGTARPEEPLVLDSNSYNPRHTEEVILLVRWFLLLNLYWYEQEEVTPPNGSDRYYEGFVELSVRHPPEVEYSVDTTCVAAAAAVVVEYTAVVVNAVVVVVAVGWRDCDCSGSEPFVAVV